MRNIHSIFVILFTLFFVSCSVDDDHTAEKTNDKDLTHVNNPPLLTTPDTTLISSADTISPMDSIENLAYLKRFEKAKADSIARLATRLEKEKLNQATMRMAHTTSLRRAIDLFAKNQEINNYIDPLALNSAMIKKNTDDLEDSGEPYPFSRLYEEGFLKGKFVVLSVNDNNFGGVNLDIIFKQKQDKVFRVWLYFISSEDRFIVKYFYVPFKFDEKMTKYYRRLYAIYLNDEKFGV